MPKGIPLSGKRSCTANSSWFEKGHHSSTATEFKTGQVSPNKGKKLWAGERKKNLVIPNLKGEQSPHWKGGLPKCTKCGEILTHYLAKVCKSCKNYGKNTPINESIRKSQEYKLWRKAVFERDDYTCQWCGDNKGGNLNADHIKPFSLFPELRFSTSNGRTLCKSCHAKTDTYLVGARYKSREDFI